MEYRREIDGLRALAVIPVIFFHAGFQAFSGGFVGVDVFFVISGYLITSIILAELDDGKFSLVNFYERRARRILPALFFVMAVCLPFAWVYLLPSDMKLFSKSIVAVSTFSSNILFWRESGYFDSAAELKPLLHTWSLAVEEQYYVLFPLLLMVVWRFGKKTLTVVLSVLLFISLLLAQWGSNVKPEAAFFLLPTRGWELLIGAIVAFYLPHLNTSKRWISEVMGIFGLLLVLYAVFIFDRFTPFPSFYALVPTIGTGLIILFTDKQTIVGKILGNKILVGIGLVSYSAYLWHQPIFAFFRIQSIEQPGYISMLVIILASFALAFFTWKYIEAPFRSKGKYNRSQIFIFSSSLSAFFILFGLSGYYTGGYKSRISGEKAQILEFYENGLPEWNYFTREKIPELFRDDCNFYDIQKYKRGNNTKIPIANITASCYERDLKFDKAVFIWGDSHAQMLHPGLQRFLPNNWQILQVASSGCKPKIVVKNRNDYCDYSNWFAYEAIIRTKPDVVVIGQNSEHDIQTMQNLSDRLSKLGIKKVIFTGPSPHWIGGLPNIATQKLLKSKSNRTYVGVDQEVLQNDLELKANFPQTGIASYVSLIDYFCNDLGCIVYFGSDIKTGLSAYDYGHITPISSYMLAKNLLAKKITDSLE